MKVTIERETGLTPNGNEIGYRWVARDENRKWIDMDAFRSDLIPRLESLGYDEIKKIGD